MRDLYIKAKAQPIYKFDYQPTFSYTGIFTDEGVIGTITRIDYSSGGNITTTATGLWVDRYTLNYN